jgi:hypothetical protein
MISIQYCKIFVNIIILLGKKCLSDSVDLNRVKQEYNRELYQFISSPFGAR